MTRLAAAALLTLLASPLPARAAQSAAEVCDGVSRKAGRTLWSALRESGDDLLCRKSWVPGLPDELAACGAWNRWHVLTSKVKNLWNRTFQGAEWATWGARGLGPDWEEGTIQGGFKRTFFGPGLAYARTTVEVVKEGGAAEATATVCVLDYDGKVVSKEQRAFASGKGGENAPVRVTLDLADNRIVGVVVDTPVQLAGRSFEYRVRLLSEPQRNDLGPVKGIADLHVHQFANIAFGGRLLWGHHSGPEETALAREEVNPIGAGTDLGTVDGLLKTLAQPGASLDANLVFTVLGGKKSDEGFWKYGGEGWPSYRDWPHHADRSHQQAHISWVKEAHQRNKESGSNLKLMVVSIVNNDILCSVAKAIDPFGNVPLRDQHGKVTGWESKSWGCSDHENVVRQLQAVHEVEKANPWYRVAMNPWHARQIIAAGDLAVVLAIETDKPLSGEGNNYGNWEQQLDFYRAMGLTSMQLVHESDSRFCGAAPHRDMMGALQAIHWPLKSIDDLFTSKYEVDGNGHNKVGLTREGEKLVDALVKRSMPIDLAHGSQRCREAVLSRVGTGYGVYDSHTKFERLLSGHVRLREQEFLVTEGLVPLYRKHKVLLGLRTSSVDVEDAPGAGGVANDCPGSARSFAQMVQYADSLGLAIAYGTDFNTGVSQLGPRYGDGRCWAAQPDLKDTITRKASITEGELPARAKGLPKIAGTSYYTHGLATIGWLPELTVDLAENLRAPGAARLRQGAEAFLAMWERAYPPEGETSAGGGSGKQPGSAALGARCTAGDQCRSGHCTGALGIAGTCVCNEDPDCAQGQYCDTGADLSKNACKARKADNEACALSGGDHQCLSGQCQAGRCFTPASVAMGGACWVDAACKQGKCSSLGGTQGSCVCDKDADCGGDAWCNRGLDLKKNACSAKLPKGAVCGTVGELGVGHRCRSGECKLTGVGTKLHCK